MRRCLFQCLTDTERFPPIANLGSSDDYMNDLISILKNSHPCLSYCSPQERIIEQRNRTDNFAPKDFEAVKATLNPQQQEIFNIIQHHFHGIDMTSQSSSISFTPPQLLLGIQGSAGIGIVNGLFGEHNLTNPCRDLGPIYSILVVKQYLLEVQQSTHP